MKSEPRTGSSREPTTDRASHRADKDVGPRRRRYRQAARLESAAATGRRIIDAFVKLTRDVWFDELTLNDVAKHAGVSVQSVIRRFGGKDGLISAVIAEIGGEIGARRTAPPGDIKASFAALLSVYEEHGDGVIRNLAQESRYPELKRIVEFGRQEHRRLTAETYAPWLDGLAPAAKREALDALVIATDIYVWKLLRRDMGRSVAQTKTAMLRLINAVLVEHTGKLIREGEKK